MPHIFRLHKGGNQTIQHWGESSQTPYDARAIAAIEDPNGSKLTHEITSIPSPFARIDLIKRAFAEVNRSGNLDGRSIYHCMVSDALDVAELFFNIDKWRDELDIIVCNFQSVVQTLQKSPSAKHRLVGNTLETYYRADAATYHFDLTNDDYFILSDKRGLNKGVNVIGATSPSTLFFSTANDLSALSQRFNLNGHRAFDRDSFTPLYKRDEAFVRLWFYYQEQMNFGANFKELADYLKLTFAKLAQQPDFDRTQLDFSPADEPSALGFDLIPVGGTSVNVRQLPLFKRQLTAVKGSDFEIVPTVAQASEAQLPLVLPCETGFQYKSLRYTTALWGGDQVAPAYCAQSLEQRTLPTDGMPQPWLCISDLLEDTLLRVPYVLEQQRYFAGVSPDGECTYLLPIKPAFFRYFTIDDLMGRVAGGKPMLEFTTQASGDGVVVTLRVPIRGNQQCRYIEFERRYRADGDLDVEHNKGVMLDVDFTTFVMPHVRFDREAEAKYNVGCVQGVSRSMGLAFHRGEHPLHNIKSFCRNPQKQGGGFKSVNYTIEALFDYMRLDDGDGHHALILPILPQQQGNEGFRFAVDLGTSNTHIEYATESHAHQHKALDLRQPVGMMFRPRIVVIDGVKYQRDLRDETNLVVSNFLPEAIGNDLPYHFPTRTVLSRCRDLSWDQAMRPFDMTNVAFAHNLLPRPTYNEAHTDVKWGRDNQQTILQAYVENLMVILRNKVVSEQGDLTRTTLTWFTPMSMPPTHRNKTEQIWRKAFEKYFGMAEGRLLHVSESSAPVAYVFQSMPNSTSLVSIDIGGGTTDVAFAENTDMKATTSFRFAGNSLFTAPYALLNQRNGIVDHYREHYEQLFANNNVTAELIQVFRQEQEKRPEDLAAFFISLAGNESLEDLQNVNFLDNLADNEHFKVLFLIFYSAIIYHVGQIIRLRGLRLPRHLNFSGNGARLLKVLTPNIATLRDYTRVLLEQVTELSYGSDKLDLLGLGTNDAPKEATCKGGLCIRQGEDASELSALPVVLRAQADRFVDKETDRLDNITPDDRRAAVKATRDFFEFLFHRLSRKFSFIDHFDLSLQSLELAKRTYDEDLMVFLEKGIEEYKTDNEGNDEIKETFFFYPIRGALHQLSLKIKEEIINQTL